MRGQIKQRSRGTWTLIFDVYERDPTTGGQKRKQKWITVRGRKLEAETKLAELLAAANGGTFVDPAKLTFGEWLDDWVERAVKPPLKRPSLRL